MLQPSRVGPGVVDEVKARVGAKVGVGLGNVLEPYWELSAEPGSRSR